MKHVMLLCRVVGIINIVLSGTTEFNSPLNIAPGTRVVSRNKTFLLFIVQNWPFNPLKPTTKKLRILLSNSLRTNLNGYQTVFYLTFLVNVIGDLWDR